MNQRSSQAAFPQAES